MAWNETVCNVRLCNGGRPQIVTDTGKSVLGDVVESDSAIEYDKETASKAMDSEEGKKARS